MMCCASGSDQVADLDRGLQEYEWMKVAAEDDTDVEAFAKSIP